MRALITGASSGIGRELALLLACRGAELILVARGEAALSALTGDLRASGAAAVDFLAVDLTDSNAVDTIVALLGDRPLDLLVNNAGCGDYGRFQDIEWDRYSKSLQLNMCALTALTHALLPGMLLSNRGCIVNVASTAAFMPLPLMAAYAASKSYVLSLSQALQFELRHTQIRVMALCPGATRTGFAAAAAAESSNNFSESNTASPAAVAAFALKKIDGGATGIVVHGFKNRLSTVFTRLVPDYLVMLLANRVMRSDAHSINPM